MSLSNSGYQAERWWLTAQEDLDYIPTRYPNGLPDLTPGQVYTSQESAQAIEKAEYFLEETRKLMNGS